MTRRSVAAAATAALAALAAAALVAAAPAAHAHPTPVGETVSTAGFSGPWTVDATCHFGPTTSYGLEDRLHVQGVAYAPGATWTSIRCVVESGNGTWVDTYAATAPGAVAATAGDDWLWSAADRLCVGAEAYFPTAGLVVAPLTCA